MTIMRQHFAYCDTESCPFHDLEAGTESFTSVRELRAKMKAEGWKRVKGKDVCPDCVDELARVGNTE